MGVAPRKLDRAAARLGVGSRLDHERHARGDRARKHLVAVRIEIGPSQMRAGVDQRSLRAKRGFDGPSGSPDARAGTGAPVAGSRTLSSEGVSLRVSHTSPALPGITG